LRLRIVIQILWNHSPASFQRVFAIPSIRDEMFQCSEEKRAESPFLGIGARIPVILDQMGEKSLRQILRILVSVLSLAQKKVHWAPINLAQF
jgi:hypothetical protein